MIPMTKKKYAIRYFIEPTIIKVVSIKPLLYASLLILPTCVNPTLKVKPKVSSLSSEVESTNDTQPAYLEDPKNYCLVKVAEENYGNAYVGKVGIRTSTQIPETDPKKVDYPDFVIPDTAAKVIDEMRKALNDSSDSLQFLKCEESNSRTSPETTDKSACNYLVTEENPEVVSNLELFIGDGGPYGDRYQMYRLSVNNVFQRSALFRSKVPLPETVSIYFRNDSWESSYLITAPLPARMNFNAEQRDYAENKIIGKIWSVIPTGLEAINIIGFSDMWEAQQFQKASILAGGTALDLVMIFGTGGVGSLSSAINAAKAVGVAGSKTIVKTLGQKAATVFIKQSVKQAPSLLVALGALTLQTAALAGQTYLALHLDRVKDNSLPGPTQDALNVLSFIAQASQVLTLGSFGLSLINGLLGSAKILFSRQVAEKVLQDKTLLKYVDNPAHQKLYAEALAKGSKEVDTYIKSLMDVKDANAADNILKRISLTSENAFQDVKKVITTEVKTHGYIEGRAGIKKFTDYYNIHSNPECKVESGSK